MIAVPSQDDATHVAASTSDGVPTYAPWREWLLMGAFNVEASITCNAHLTTKYCPRRTDITSHGVASAQIRTGETQQYVQNITCQYIR
eukprot:4741338-Amphidinium_carterae.2